MGMVLARRVPAGDVRERVPAGMENARPCGRASGVAPRVTGIGDERTISRPTLAKSPVAQRAPAGEELLRPHS